METEPEGIHLVLDREQAKQLFRHRDDDSLRTFLSDATRAALGTPAAASSGSLWEPLHLCLSTASAEAEKVPLEQAVLGGRPLGSELVARLIRPDLVPHVATALENLDESAWTARIAELKDEVDAAQLASVVTAVGQLFRHAADEGHCVVFWVGGSGNSD